MDNVHPMRETHVITCGVSLLVNTARSLKGKGILDDEKLDYLSNYAKMEEALNSLSQEEKRKLEDQMLSFLRQDPRRASAEMNALLGYLDEVVGAEVEKVHLLVSDTEAGKITANVLLRYLEEDQGIDTDRHVVQGFGSEDFRRALKNLTDTVRGIVKSSKNVVLNLTGGFKAEIAALSALAAESGLKAYYIHERSRKVVMLPTAEELKVRVTKWEKIGGILALLLGVPYDSILGSPIFIPITLALAAVTIWVMWTKV